MRTIDLEQMQQCTNFSLDQQNTVTVSPLKG
jgi:hypothetical protein